MPELAAHLERVAESLAPKLAAVLFARENRDDPQAPTWEELCADPDQESCVNAWLHQVTPLLPIVAAALAACAREAKLEAIKSTIQAFEHEYMNTGEPLSGVARGIRAMCELKFAAERAVGEKASLDPQGGQHES